MRFLIIIFCLAVLSCKKDRVRGTKASLSVVNASPNSSGIELLQNLNSINTYNYINGLNGQSGYIMIDSGFQNYKLRTGNNEIASFLFANEGLQHSLYVFDSAVAGRVNYFFLNDDLDTAGLGKRCKIRIVHISPNLDSLDFVTQHPTRVGVDSAIYSDVPYFGNYDQATLLGVSNFTNFPADTLITLRIRRKINNTIARSYQFNFVKGKVYTFVVKGYDGRAGRDSLSMSIIKHN
ncbi:MAG TPA: DUF4397 domain-containing protein [Lacibacter sp.]|nr:DUF4397 domain-containing protein [Lacibacter sp.]